MPRSKAEEDERKYGSADRREFVRSLSCAACGGYGSQNAHLLGNGGMGRKADHTTIGPLCRKCHRLYDEKRWVFNAKFPSFDAELVAATTEQQWQSYSAERSW